MISSPTARRHSHGARHWLPEPRSPFRSTSTAWPDQNFSSRCLTASGSSLVHRVGAPALLSRRRSNHQHRAPDQLPLVVEHRLPKLRFRSNSSAGHAVVVVQRCLQRLRLRGPAESPNDVGAASQRASPAVLAGGDRSTAADPSSSRSRAVEPGGSDGSDHHCRTTRKRSGLPGRRRGRRTPTTASSGRMASGTTALFVTSTARAAPSAVAPGDEEAPVPFVVVAGLGWGHRPAAGEPVAVPGRTDSYRSGPRNLSRCRRRHPSIRFARTSTDSTVDLAASFPSSADRRGKSALAR